MRILIAHNVPGGRNGGMNRIMGFIHDEIESAGHVIEYFCSESVKNSSGRMARFTFGPAVIRHARAAWRAGRPYDVINIHEPSGALVALGKRQTGAHVVVTSHGLESRGWKVALQDGVPLKSRIGVPTTILWQARLALQYADHVFCLNFEDRDTLVQRGIPASRITRIYPAADPIFGQTVRDYSRANTFLFAGTWLARKGIHDVAAAFSRVSLARPGVRLVVLNPGVPETTVLEQFPEILRERVSCVRAAPEKGIADIFASADIFVLPSIFEGTPLTMMEALWSGMPIIATDTCGMHDVLRQQDNALLIPVRAPERLEKAMIQLLDDPQLRAKLGTAARQDAKQHYTWQQSAQPVQKVYEALAGFEKRLVGGKRER
jgi:glycosyltransferase involved in cell wall biosynthesis